MQQALHCTLISKLSKRCRHNSYFWGVSLLSILPAYKNLLLPLSNPTYLPYPSFVYALATRASHLEYHSQASPPARLPRTRQLDPLLSATERLTNSRLRMPRWQQGKSTRVHDPQPLYAVYSSLGVDDRVRIVLRSHGAYVSHNISI